MTIELANRLVGFRKKFGYSQEELANQLNVSRQSISNWESGEVTPSIDYLKELAKIYGVSMDDLINCDKPIDDVINKKADAKSESSTNEEKTMNDSEDKSTTSSNGDKVNIGKDGIHVHSKDGDNVDIDLRGIHVNGDDIKKSFYDSDYKATSSYFIKTKKRKKLSDKVNGIVTSVFSLLVVVAYLLLGFLANGWGIYWPLFILIPVPGLICTAIIRRKFNDFPIPLVVTFAYLMVGTYFGLWHPYWLLFLIIPIYYTIFSPIDKAIFDHNLQKEKDDSVITVNGEDIKVHKDVSDSLDSFDERIEKLNNKVSSIDKVVNTVKKESSDVNKDFLDDIKDEIDDVEEEIENLEDDMDDLFDEVDIPLQSKIDYRSKVGSLKAAVKNVKDRL